MYAVANANAVYHGRFCWCGNVCSFTVYTAILIGLCPVKSSRCEDPLAYVCDVSYVVVSCNRRVTTKCVQYSSMFYILLTME